MYAKNIDKQNLVIQKRILHYNGHQPLFKDQKISLKVNLCNSQHYWKEREKPNDHLTNCPSPKELDKMKHSFLTRICNPLGIKGNIIYLIKNIHKNSTVHMLNGTILKSFSLELEVTKTVHFHYNVSGDKANAIKNSKKKSSHKNRYKIIIICR